MNKLNICFFIPGITLVLLLAPNCLGLASKAFYRIQNEGTKFCLSVGPVIRFAPVTKTLFKDGLVVTRNCSLLRNLTANGTDFAQQWLVDVRTEDPRKFNFNVQLRMQNTHYVDKQLGAVIRGEFISYFPNTINLKGDRSIEEKSQSQQFIISDTLTQKCLVDSEINQVRFTKCDNSYGKYQWWSFTLINEIEAAKAEANSNNT